MEEKIDFVILWVDGNESKWREKLNQYLFGVERLYITDERFRDWDNLQYWFRGVEKFAPFVNRIHFITEGHLPKWLNTKHPKLNIVKHSDYIPNEYLPTFNDNAIELNIYRINGLEENFVLFNDDIFLTDYVSKEYFFKNGKPVDNISETPIVSKNAYSVFEHILLNCISIINKNFDKQEYVKGKLNLIDYKQELNQDFNSFENFFSFYHHHLSQSYKKSIFEEVWKKEEEILNETNKNRFRSMYDMCHYLIRYWQIVTGNVVVEKNKNGKSFSLSDDELDEVIESIKLQKYKEICINDSRKVSNFERTKEKLKEAFEIILPDKSEFEI